MAIELTTATAEQISGIQDALNLDIPVLTEYPTTDATKVGQKFIYKGNEWKYHSQAELDGLGWTTVSEGFPAPVRKILSTEDFIQDTSNGSIGVVDRVYAGAFLAIPQFRTRLVSNNIEINFLHLGFTVTKMKGAFINIETSGVGSIVTKIRNAELLVNVEDQGTVAAIVFAKTTGTDLNISDIVLNDFFTQLPITTKTATIEVRNTTGAGTCDPTIATSKGYTVVT